MRTRIALLLLLASTAPAFGQVVASRQILDRVYAFDSANVLNMAFGNADRPPDFTNLGVTGSAFQTCTVTPIGGLFCLDGETVRSWPNPLQPSVSSVVLSCSDPGLRLSKGDGCVAMTVNQSGAIWLSVRKRNGHSILKVIAKGTACPDGTWSQVSGGTRCAKELYSGRPPVIDLVAIDGDLAKNFRPCGNCAPQSGVIGIEERKNTMFFPDPQAAAAVTVVSGRDWGLQGKELLQDIAVLQLPGSTYPVETTLLATTTTGRVLARSSTVTGAARQVFNLPAARALRSPAPQACNASAQQYGMRASMTTGILYISDRNYCEVIALEPASDALISLVYVLEGTEPLILTTNDPPETYGVIGLSIAPGISIDLSDCTENCAFINSPDGSPAAELSGVQLGMNSASGATIFQIKDIPDCRYAARPGFPKRAVCDSKSGVVIDPTGAAVDVRADGTLDSAYPAAAMHLNVTPLIPDEVVLAFNASGLRPAGLPALLISPQYRAQSRTNYIFEAIFAIPQPNVRFINTFGGEFDVAGLEGTASSLGCTPGTGSLIAWDVVTHASEVYASVGGKFVDTLSNIGCGSVKIGGQRMSIFPYDLQVNPDTWGPTLTSTSPVLTVGNDAVFARLLQGLYGDLDYVQRELACKPVDVGSGPAPIAANTCNSLTSTWNNGKTKLDKCILAAFQPKSSASNENCQSFVSQLTNFRNALPATTPNQDVANRVGELKKRLDVIFHLYYTRFQPSIPANGFCREGGATGCANPWT